MTGGGGLQVVVSGEGSDRLPLDESHLVLTAMRAAFDTLGVDQPSLRLICRNAIPQGGGWGPLRRRSSPGCGWRTLFSAARRCPATRCWHWRLLSRDIRTTWPPACWGRSRSPGSPKVVRELCGLDVHPDIRAAVLVPPAELVDRTRTGLLPSDVPHGSASANAGRAALLVAALTALPGLLFEATEDALHQEYRRPGDARVNRPDARMRAAGLAAVVSGAGPSVLALGTLEDGAEIRRQSPDGWLVKELAVATTGAGLVRGLAFRGDGTVALS